MSEPLGAASLGMNALPTTRRAALAALAVPLAAQSAVNTDDIAEVVALAADKNAAFMRGDMERWSTRSSLCVMQRARTVHFDENVWPHVYAGVVA